MLELRDAHLINHKNGMGNYIEQGEKILDEWGWL
jgi:hypothetical protein